MRVQEQHAVVMGHRGGVYSSYISVIMFSSLFNLQPFCSVNTETVSTAEEEKTLFLCRKEVMRRRQR